ncbi:hypothetical protein BDZ89DRAFT_1065407 [Hymenopellis radicata]|nr:hypothetical protein BDZ89DRAFT_1065407 [Hymenopellis radicata]
MSAVVLATPASLGVSAIMYALQPPPSTASKMYPTMSTALHMPPRRTYTSRHDGLFEIAIV